MKNLSRPIKLLILAAASTWIAGAQPSAIIQAGPAGMHSGCVVPYHALAPFDSSTINDEDLQLLPVDARDEDLACGGRNQAGVNAELEVEGASPTGWTVIAGSVREFHSLDNLYLFSVAAVKDRTGRQGVLLSRGIYIVVGGKKILNWERRVITNDQLVEYNAQPADSLLDWFDDLVKYFVDKVVPLIEQEFGKLVTDAIKTLFKELDKWLQKEIASLFKKGGSSQMPKLLLAQMQISGASNQSVERYVTSIIASRSSNFTKADRVFVSLDQPVTQTNDIRAGKALSKAIESIR